VDVVPDAPEAAAGPLTTRLDEPDSVPYFLWDEPMTVDELHQRLRSASRPERVRLLAKILREAKDADVWRFTSPAEVVACWQEIAPRLGRRRGFWEYLLRMWRELGCLEDVGPR
jgi:hypothetical protein